MAEQAPAPLAPIIIKRIKKGGHGHHGGAWKVAYADFVTAMMAFFLLLWLINVTSPEQKMGLAEYFMPTIGIKDAQGIGFKGGKKPSSKPGRSSEETTAPGIVIGQMPQGPVPQAPDSTPAKPDPNAIDRAAEPSTKSDTKDSADDDAFKTTTEEIKQALRQDQDIDSYQNNIIVEDTPEGLKIDMIDDAKKPMFIPGTATLTDMGKKVLDSMSAIVLKTPNNITIKGNTDASGATANPQYTNWELSADRANAARRFLITAQMEPERVMKVIGMADRELLTPAEPTSARNRRVTLILMRGSYFRDPKTSPTTRSIISVSDPKPAKPEEKKPPIEVKPPKDNATSIFNPLLGTDKPEIEIKEPEARPELNLPSPKAVAPKPKAETPPPQKKGPSDGASIFNPQAPVEKVIPLRDNDARPELNLDKPKAPAKKPAAEPQEDLDEGAGLQPSIYERSPSAQGMSAYSATLKLH